MKKILLIEDNTEIRENMAEILELAGYTVYTAADGKQGVEQALQDRPDLIICDIMMPVLDGYGVLHLVQKNEELQSVPFIFLTARSERNEVRKGMEMGADDYITKPFDGTELLQAIEIRLRKADALKKSLPPSLQGVDELVRVHAASASLEALSTDRSTNKYKKKQLIYTEGNHPVRLFYLKKGKVKTYKRNEEGKELIIGLYKEGDFLGYTPLMEGGPYHESAEALEETELAIIPRSEFEALLGSNPAVLRKFISILAQDIDEKENQLLALAYNSLRKKVADTLVTLYRKYNSEADDHFMIDLSRENLASIAGVAKESLIRMLGELKEEKLITMEGSRIRILNYSKLEQMYN